MSSTSPIALFGCKSTTRFLLDALLDGGQPVHLITIGPEKGSKQEVADYADLQAYGRGRGVPVYVAQKYSLQSPTDEAFFRDRPFELGFVVGWQRLIPAAILGTFATGVFGMHGSAMDLPLGRGRSPMNWSILEGRDVFYTNLFRYDPGADDGDVLDTYKFQITVHDTGETMHFKNTLAMKCLIERNLARLRDGTFTLSPQRPLTPTYYPRRYPADSLIDWSADIVTLERFIRAVAPPFNGAYTYLKDRKVIITRAVPFDVRDFGLTASAPGEVVTVFPNGKFLVYCYGGLLLVHEYETEVWPSAGDCFTTGPETLRHFPRNTEGFHDLPANDT